MTMCCKRGGFPPMLIRADTRTKTQWNQLILNSSTHSNRALHSDKNEGAVMLDRIKKISGPVHEEKYPDRNVDCQTATAERVIDLMEEVEKAGWSAVEAARAINDVSRGLFVGNSGTPPTNRAIEPNISLS